MSDLRRFVSAAVVAAVIYYITLVAGAAAGLGAIGALLILLESKLDTIAKAMDFNFRGLRHLQRFDND